MSDTILKFITDLEELEKKATLGEWGHEEERYSARNVIGVRPNDDRWIVHCQPEFNGYGNAEFIAHSRNALPKLLAAMRILVDACEWYGDNCENKVAKYTTEEQVRYSGELAREALARVKEILK